MVRGRGRNRDHFSMMSKDFLVTSMVTPLSKNILDSHRINKFSILKFQFQRKIEKMTGEGAKRSRYYTPNEGLVHQIFFGPAYFKCLDPVEFFLNHEKVALHNTPNDLWVSFLGKVFDLTVLVQNNKGPDINFKGSGSACGKN